VVLATCCDSISYMRPTSQVLLLATLLILGCSDNPAFSDEVSARFASAREALEELESKVEQGGFYRVVSGYGEKAMFYTSPDDPGEYQSDVGEWGDLFRSARVISVKRGETGIGFLADYAQFRSVKSHGEVLYVHDESLQDNINKSTHCGIDVTDSDEGHCVVKLGNDWYAFYTWIQLQ
jgi:hypothetical protein